MALNDFSASIDQKLSDIADLPGSLDNESPSVLPYLEVSKPYSLDSIVKAKAAAKELNRPEPLVLDTLPDSLMEIQARRIENNQLFAGWASQSARNAAIAREDYEKLTPVFDSITNWNMTRSQNGGDALNIMGIASGIIENDTNKIRGVERSVQKTIGRAPGLASKMGYDSLALGYGTAAAFLDALPVNIAKPVREWLWSHRDQALEFSQLSSNYLSNPALNLPPEKQGRTWDNPKNILDMEWLSFKTGEAATQLILMLAGGQVMGGGTLATAIVGSIGEGGGLYTDLILDQVPNDRALAASLGFGAFTALLNKLGLDKILDKKSSRGILRGFRDILIAGGIEGLTEFAENPVQAWLTGLAKEESAEEIGYRVVESLKDGFDVVPGSVVVGSGVKTLSIRSGVARAKEYADQTGQIHEALEGTKLKQASPELTQELLENSGVDQKVYVPAEAALELFQSDQRFGEAFGLTVEEMTEAAAMGQAVEVPLARAMAQLDAEQFGKVKEVMRESPEAPNLNETQDNSHLSEEVERVVKKFQEQEEAREAYSVELDRLKSEMKEAAKKTPGMLTQLDDVDGVVQLYDHFARRMFSDQASQTDFLKKVQITTSGTKFADGAQVYFQDQAEGGKYKTAEVVTIDPSEMVIDGRPVDLTDTKELLKWLRNKYQGKTVTIADDGKIVEFSRRGLDSGLKRRGETQRQIYAGIDGLLEKSIFDGFEFGDSRHPALSGQNIYYAAARIGDDLYSVRFKIDLTHTEEISRYKDHKTEPIKIDPSLYPARNPKKGHQQNEGPITETDTSLYPALSTEGGHQQNEGSISDIRIEILKGDVKPSGIKNGVLFQSSLTRRGSVTITPQASLIKIYKGAELSTLIHETGHIFEAEMRRLVEAGLADKATKEDLARLDKWLSQLDDDGLLKKEYNRRIKKLPGFGKNFNKLTPKQKRDARETAKKEHFARAFEAYAREGRAPSADLERVFNRFKRWLSAIYKDARQLGVELTDEVRGFFDRMLVSEAEVSRASVENELFSLTEKELDALGVKGLERTYQAALMEAAKRKAVEELQKDRDRDRSSRRAQWGREAREELMKDRVYQARSEIASKDGALDIDLVAELYGKESVKSLRKSLGPDAVKKGGQDPTLLAARYGFADGAAMIAAVTEAEGLGKSIEKIVAAQEAAHDAQLSPTDYLLETEEAARQINLVGEYLARNLGREHIQRKQFARVASDQLDKMSLRKARMDGQYLAAMRRALRKERRAIGSGDFEAALEANIQAQINMEMARQARQIRDLQETTVKNAKRFVGMAKGDPAARFLVNDIAARFGLMPYNQRLIDGKDSGTIANWLKDREGDGFNIFIDAEILSGQRDWREITTAEFYNVADSIAQVMAVERNQRKLLSAEGKESFEEAVAGGIDSIQANHKARPVKTIEEQSLIKQAVEAIDASHRKIEALLFELDGGKPLGANWELIYKPLNAAENRRGMMFKGLAARLNGEEIFGAYTFKERNELFTKKVFIKEVGESVTKSQAMMVALNKGNDGNYSRLLEGRNWSEEQVDAVTAILEEREWKAVQALWDTFEGYKAEAFNLQEEVTGMRPTSVEARPFMTPYGEMRGGYFPVIYDQRHAKVDIQEKTINNENPAFGMTRHGHLKERNSKGAGTPLSLDLAEVPARLNDVISDLCFRRAFIDVSRVLRNKEYRAAVEGAVGHAKYKAMTDWLKDSVKISHPRGSLDSLVRWGRTSSTAMAMGFKATTILTQPLGFTQSIELLGYNNAIQGLNMAFGKGPGETININNWVKSVSPFMEQRLKTYDRDISEATADFARKDLAPDNLLKGLTSKVGLQKFEKWMKDNAFVPMGIVQYGVDLPTWLGAYQKGLKDFSGNETKAIDYADSVVRLSQGSGRNIDLAKIQRGGELLKTFTMFYSYFNTLYNLTALRVGDVKMNRDGASVIRAANSALLLFVVPAILGELITGRGPDDDEEFLGWAARELMAYPMETVVGLRSLSGTVRGDDFGYKVSPAETAPETVFNFLMTINKLISDEDYEADGKKLAKLGLKTTGYVTGTPLTQAEITIFNIIDYLDGTSEDYELRDLFFRRQQSRR